MRKPDRFDVIRVPHACWSAALDALRTAGSRGLECMVYFAGTFDGAAGIVTRTVVPRQRQSAISCEPTIEDIDRISADCVRRHEVLLLQLHSHPGAAFLSSTDRGFPVSRKTGWISAVAPSFGRSIERPQELSVYEYRGGSDWHEMSATERAARLVLV
jgi:proteasome lid subunit RPN8/RPN11